MRGHGASGDFARAESRCNFSDQMNTQYQEPSTGEVEPSLASARTRIAQGDLDGARQQIDSYLQLHPKDRRGWFQRGRIAVRDGDLPTALSAMQRAVTLGRGRSALHTAHLARLLMATGRLAEAGELLETALARLGDRAVLLAQGMKQAIAAGDLDRATRYGERYLAVFTTDARAKPSVLIAMARAQRDRLDDAAAQAIIERGLQHWPGSVVLLQGKAQICVSIGRKAQACAVLREQLLVQPDLDPDLRARTLDRLAFLEGRAYVGLDGQMVQVREHADPDALAVQMNGDSTQGMFVRRTPGARKLLLVFTGVAGEAGNVPLSLLDEMLRGLPVHVVYLRDYQRVLYLKGIPELGADHARTVDGLRALQQDLGADALYCMGNSGGGYAAIQYGAALGADTVLGLAAATSTDMAEVRKVDPRGESMVLRMQAEVPELLGNLRDVVQRAPRPPRVLLHYGDAMPVDVFHAENFADLPTAQLFPMPGIARHDIAAQLLAEGRLEQVIREAIGA